MEWSVDMSHSILLTIGQNAPDKLIGIEGVAKLAGAMDKNWPLKMQREQPTFPAPVQGGVGQGRSLWRQADIIDFLNTYRPVKKGSSALNKLQSLDDAMAQQIIRRGWKRGGRAIGRAVLEAAVRAGGAL